MISLLLSTALLATPLIDCHSGKSGQLQLSLEKTAEGMALTSTDASQVNPRTLTGTVVRASRKALDKRHQLYRFELKGGVLLQVNGIDGAHCQPDQASARCAITALEVQTVKQGTRGPGDTSLHVFAGAEPVAMEDGGPQGCTVLPSKALTALLKSRK
jgi:hypothetical protein